MAVNVVPLTSPVQATSPIIRTPCKINAKVAMLRDVCSLQNPPLTPSKRDLYLAVQLQEQLQVQNIDDDIADIHMEEVEVCAIFDSD
jgi:hypothetical protein